MQARQLPENGNVGWLSLIWRTSRLLVFLFTYYTCFIFHKHNDQVGYSAQRLTTTPSPGDERTVDYC